LRLPLTLSVSGDAARITIAEHFSQVQEGVPENKYIVFLHLGVHGAAHCFNLENTGWNDADFRCPDERGWTPVKEPIIAENGLGSYLTTTLPLDQIHNKLR
jgi:pyroglutamyl-peptidase